VIRQIGHPLLPKSSLFSLLQNWF